MNTSSIVSDLTLLQLALIIQAHSSNVYLVGGCVRDLLLGKNPNDFDLVTDGDLDGIEEALKENGWVINEAGKSFLVLIASKNGKQYEVALFRNDGTYADGRRPDSVSIGDINSDAERRDFTINSLYYDPFNHKLLDPTLKGINDLNNKVIRFNGKKAEERVLEDHLRILRAYRFASRLKFSMHPKTLKACRKNFHLVHKLSPSRVLAEIEKMNGIV